MSHFDPVSFVTALAGLVTAIAGLVRAFKGEKTANAAMTLASGAHERLDGLNKAGK